MPQLYAVAVYGFTEPSATPISMRPTVKMGGSVMLAALIVASWPMKERRWRRSNTRIRAARARPA